MGRLSTTTLAPENFVEYGVELEDLKISEASLKVIKSHAFKNIRGIKRLDLSDNLIETIENDAFSEVTILLIKSILDQLEFGWNKIFTIEF